MMGEVGGFLKIHRSGVVYDDPVERLDTHPYEEFLVRRSDEELSAGSALHGLRRAVLPQRLPAREPDPGLERPRVPRALGAGDPSAARDEQLPGVHRSAVPGPVRSRLRPGDPRGRRGLDQADRALDHRPRVGQRLGRAATARRRERTQRRSRRLRAGWPRCRPAAASRGSCSRAVRARRGARRPDALRRAGLQDREGRHRAPRAAARRRGRRAALWHRCRQRHQRRAAARAVRRGRHRDRLARPA